jgi:hypothetical protein
MAGLLTVTSIAQAQTSAQSPESAPAAEVAAPRLRVGGQLSISFSPADPYYFNYTDYDQNALRLVVATVAATYAVTGWLDAVGEVRTENADRALFSALYARLRPAGARPLTIAVGRVPPVFGASARLRYGARSPLVSLPLGYQYLSTLRSDAVPLSADALLAVRGQGWFVAYPEPVEASPGGPVPPGAYDDVAYAAPGLPLISVNRWDTGVVAEWYTPTVTVAASATIGSLSKPRVDEDNSGKGVAARVEWRPVPPWTFGASGARGAFLTQRAARRARSGSGGHQSAVGIDAAFAAGHLQVRGELIAGSWTVPDVAEPHIGGSLGATAITVEAQYRLHPRIDAAMRADRLAFSSITGTQYGLQPTPWDADVTRLEVGASYRLTRRMRFKVAYQYNWRFGSAGVERGYPAAQLIAWF